MKHILDNIQYFYECSDKARETHSVMFFGNDNDPPEYHEKGDIISDDDDEVGYGKEDVREITEADVDEALKERYSGRELLYAETAMNLKNKFQIFDHAVSRKQTPYMAHLATHGDLRNEEHWRQCLAEVKTVTGGRYDDDKANETGDVVAKQEVQISDYGVQSLSDSVKSAEHLGGGYELNEKEKIAYTILMNYSGSKKCPNVCMFDTKVNSP